MAKEAEEIVDEGTVSNKTYVTATFEKGDKVLDRYQVLRTIGGYLARDIVSAGVDGLYNSSEFKAKAKAFVADMKL